MIFSHFLCFLRFFFFATFFRFFFFKFFYSFFFFMFFELFFFLAFFELFELFYLMIRLRKEWLWDWFFLARRSRRTDGSAVRRTVPAGGYRPFWRSNEWFSSFGYAWKVRKAWFSPTINKGKLRNFYAFFSRKILRYFLRNFFRKNFTQLFS